MTAAATTPTPLLRVRALNKRFGAFQSCAASISSWARASS